MVCRTFPPQAGSQWVQTGCIGRQILVLHNQRSSTHPLSPLLDSLTPPTCVLSSPRFPLPPPSHQPHQAPHPSASSSVCWQVDVTVVLTYGLWGFCPVRNDSLLSEYKCKHTQSQVHTCKHSRTYLLELARLHIHQHLTHTLCSIHVAFNPQ